MQGWGDSYRPGEYLNVVVYDEKVRTGCASLFEKMNSLIGKTEFCRVFFEGTENSYLAAIKKIKKPTGQDRGFLLKRPLSDDPNNIPPKIFANTAGNSERPFGH